jgi:hypothetical protein
MKLGSSSGNPGRSTWNAGKPVGVKGLSDRRDRCPALHVDPDPTRKIVEMEMVQHHVRSQVMQDRRFYQESHPTPHIDPLIKQQSWDRRDRRELRNRRTPENLNKGEQHLPRVSIRIVFVSVFKLTDLDSIQTIFRKNTMYLFA